MATTVLIVDDQPVFRRVARRILEGAGFDVVGEAEDGRTAIAAASRLHPDVVLLDVLLPDATGFDISHRLARRRRPAQVVLVSSRPEGDYGPRVSESPVQGFIWKGDLSGAAVRALLKDPA